MKILPINLDDLMSARTVESVRLEFKKTASDPTLEQIIHTVCAFANDFHNLNGGYIVLGVEEENGLPILPPVGLEPKNLDRIQKRIRGNCKRIEPEYLPIISPERKGQPQGIAPTWHCVGAIPCGCPISKYTKIFGESTYYVRLGSETVVAQDDSLTQLMQMTAKVPFDDRRNLTASLDALSPALVRHFLSEIKSDLVAPNVDIPAIELYRKLRLVFKVNGHEVPKNVALLFFSDQPEDFFPGTRIEVVQFADEAGGDLIEEKIFRGPVQTQLSQVLDYLNAFNTTLIKKVPHQAKAQKMVAFPYEAMEETIVNAVYHRSYEGNPEPIKVYLYPDRMAIINYPGPVSGIKIVDFNMGYSLPEVPYRNRRIGEFLKALKLAEGRGTGVPKIHRKMKENGSPAPRFEFDEASRTYFKVVLPAHPQYIVIHALRESAHLWAVGERQRAISNLESAIKGVPQSGALLAQLIEYKGYLGNLSAVEHLLTTVETDSTITDRHLPLMAIAKLFIDHNRIKKASEILAHVPPLTRDEDLMALSVFKKRLESNNQ